MNTPVLASTYLGLKMKNPFVVSSCPLTGKRDSLLELEEAGAAAVVLPSLFQEQVEHEELELGRLRDLGAEGFFEATTYLPEFEVYNAGPDGYLRLVEQACEALSIPVIANLNGVSLDGWTRYAERIEAAGADALELNVLYVPTDPRHSAADVEALLVEEVTAVRAAVSIPIAVKIGPHFTAPLHLGMSLARAGAEGLVVFNRPLEPDIDLENLAVVPSLKLSRSGDVRLPLRWIAILSAHTNLSLAATSGVHDAFDAAKLLLAGADAVCTASVLLKEGPGFLRELRSGLSQWLTENEYESVAQMKGSMNHVNCPDPRGYERLNYTRALTSFSGPWT